MAAELFDLVVGDALDKTSASQGAIGFLLAEIIAVEQEHRETFGRLAGDIIGACDKHVGIGNMQTRGENLVAVGEKEPSGCSTARDFKAPRMSVPPPGSVSERAKFQSPAISFGR